MNVMLAGDVDPRSRIFNPSSREMVRMNSLKPVERRLIFSPGTKSSSPPRRPAPPNILLNMPGATAHHCMGSAANHQSPCADVTGTLVAWEWKHRFAGCTT